MEQGKSADREGKVSRRTTRTFVEEQKFMDVVTPGSRDEKEKGQEKEKELEKEKEKEKSGRRTRSSSTSTIIDVDIRMYPVVDIGKDLSGAFPTSVEDFGKHVVKSLQAAKSATKERVDNRPISFGEVIPGQIFRSSFPVEEDFQFLKTLGLKTIVSLVKKDFIPEFQAFMKENGITHRIVEMQGTKKVNIPESTMRSVMEIVLDKENYPVLIHCNHGKHRTGCAVGVIRKVVGWQNEEIVEEYSGFASPKVRDCDIKYLAEYQVSSLRHLFTNHEIRRRQPVLTSPKMMQLMILTTILLAIWYTTFLL